jgi:hypothetical protein
MYRGAPDESPSALRRSRIQLERAASLTMASRQTVVRSSSFVIRRPGDWTRWRRTANARGASSSRRSPHHAHSFSASMRMAEGSGWSRLTPLPHAQLGARPGQGGDQTACHLRSCFSPRSDWLRDRNGSSRHDHPEGRRGGIGLHVHFARSCRGLPSLRFFSSLLVSGASSRHLPPHSVRCSVARRSSPAGRRPRQCTSRFPESGAASTPPIWPRCP